MDARLQMLRSLIDTCQSARLCHYGTFTGREPQLSIGRLMQASQALMELEQEDAKRRESNLADALVRFAFATSPRPHAT